MLICDFQVQNLHSPRSDKAGLPSVQSAGACCVSMGLAPVCSHLTAIEGFESVVLSCSCSVRKTFNTSHLYFELRSLGKPKN